MKINGFSHIIGSLVLLCLAWVPSVSHAWIFPEHHDISRNSLGHLTPEEQALMAQIWSGARESEPGLCESYDANSGTQKCADYSVLPAIGGDHSCSPDDMRMELRNQEWFAGVLGVSDAARQALKESDDIHEFHDAWKDSHLDMQLEDKQYGARATNNNAHFARFFSAEPLIEYLHNSLKPDERPNAMGVYVGYHAAALRLAALAAATKDPATKKALAARALWAEAFGVHFLQDLYAAGHIVGDWGGAAELKGTHDYYCEHGIVGRGWDGNEFFMKGDAFMREEDSDLTSAAVYASLKQVLQAYAGDPRYRELAAAWPAEQAAVFEKYDVCAATLMPQGTVPDGFVEISEEVAVLTAKPSYPKETSGYPRFRAEIGGFLGLTASASQTQLFGGYGSPEGTTRLVPAMDLGVRLGFGPEGVTTRGSDAHTFIGASLVLQAQQYDTVCVGECEGRRTHDQAIPRVPSRMGLELRIRMPFFLLPFDLLILGPVLFIADQDALVKVGVMSARGGLIPWQQVLLTGIGDFQFMLGREVGVQFLGFIGEAPVADIDLNADGNYEATQFKSLYFEFPFFEWTPVRNFQSVVTQTIRLQVGGTWDHVLPLRGEPDHGLEDSYGFFFRLAFDSRHYF